MSTPPATPRFATLGRALLVLLLIVGGVGAELIPALLVGSKPSGNTIAVEVTRDAPPEAATPAPAVPVLATTAETTAPAVPPAPVTTSQEVKPQEAAPETATPAPKPCQEDQPCWDPCTMGNKTPCDVTPAPKPCQEDQPCWDPCTMGNKTPCDVTPAPETATPAPKPCQEDQPCWNSCTMGNQGPCDALAVLPNGARFHVEVTFTPGSDCWDGWVLSQVTVSVRSAAGVELAQGGLAAGCAPGGDVFVGQGVGSMLPMLYRQAASQLH